MKNHLYIMLFLLSSQILCAQWRDVRLTYIGPEDGLTMRVSDIVQDSTGYIYFGGTQGLIKYDGVSLQPFQHDPDDSTSIQAGEVWRVMLDSRNQVWMTHRLSGVSRFDPVKGDFRQYEFPRADYEIGYGASALYEDDQGDVWFGGYHNRLYKWDREKDSIQVFYPQWLDQASIKGRNLIARIMQDIHDPDLFWLTVIDYKDPREIREIGLGYGLMSFHRVEGTFRSFPNVGMLDNQEPSGRLITTHLTNQIVIFDPASEDIEIHPFETSDYPAKYISRDILYQGGEKWLITAGEIMELNGFQVERSIYHVGKEEPQFLKFVTDRNHLLWICAEQGVYALEPKRNQIQFFSLDEFEARERVYPGRLAFDPKTNSVFLAYTAGVSNRRIYRIPLDQHRSADYIRTPHSIHGLATDMNGNTWAAGGGNLYSLNGDELIQNQIDGLVPGDIPWLWNMHTSPLGYIGMVGFDQFIWFHPDSSFSRRIQGTDLFLRKGKQVPNNELMGASYGRNGLAYVFSSHVYEVNLFNGKARPLKFDPSFNPDNDEIYDVDEDANGYLWIGSSQYFGKFRKSGDSLELEKAYTLKDGLTESQMTETHIDHQGRIWCFTVSGINCIDDSTGEIRYFGVQEGLPHVFTDPRQILTLPDNRIATVNSNGLIVFHPDSLWNSKSTQSVPVVINEVRVDGRPINTDVAANYLSAFEIPPGKHVVDILFQGLAFPKADQLNYSYRLSGLSEEWIDIGTNRFVTLSGISPGKYVFEVKAGTPVSSSPVRKLEVRVPTPFHQRAWFIALIVSLILAVIYLIYQYRLKQVRNEEAEKTRINKQIAELELKALRSQMNPHFMFNSLNSIKNFILRAEKTEAAEYLSNFAHLIRLILQNSRERQISLQDELETLMLYIELEQLRFDDSFEFNCEIGEGVRMEQTFIPPMILQPYVENAIWHGLMHKKGKGILSIQFEKCDDAYVCCMIEDDGVGREKAMELKDKSIRKYKSMGMGITSDRIELMNQMDAFGISVDVIDLTAEQDGHTGTRVVVKVPVRNEQG